MEKIESKMVVRSVVEESLESILYNEARAKIEKILQDIKKDRPILLAPASEIVSKFIDSLSERQDLVRNAIYSKGPAVLDVSTHLVNVCVFAVEIGIGLRYEEDELKKLGMTALLHDIGMARVPENILKKPGKLSNEEFNIVKRHPEEGAAIVKGISGNNTEIAEIILQEHERFDGKGYPRGLKGNEIHEFALIIGIADLYEALTHHRFQRKNLPPFDSMKEILSVERSSFPEKIIKALLSRLPVFPVGSIVRLNSQEIGVVVSTDSYSPFRPTVEIILDTSGKKPRKEKIINLKENPMLYIISLVSEEDIHLVKD